MNEIFTIINEKFKIFYIIVSVLIKIYNFLDAIIRERFLKLKNWIINRGLPQKLNKYFDSINLIII